jgi:pyruvate dehydrogenase E2 component (dihydrolipoamide acetyltransferase)
MALEFKLPDIGEGIAEGEIVKWLVKAGDAVAEHQPVVEVMTDKATVEIPAPQAGRITELRVKEGEVVPVGQVLFVLESGAGAGKAATLTPAAPTAPARPAPAARPVPAPVAARPAAPPAPESVAPLPKGSGATLSFKLPDIGEGIAEGEIVKWLVKEGDVVAEHQPIVEVMTDKATVEIPAPAAGTITAIKAKAGQVVPIGTVLFDLATSGAAPPARVPAHAPALVGATAAAAPATTVARSAAASARRPERAASRASCRRSAAVPGSGRGGTCAARTSRPRRARVPRHRSAPAPPRGPRPRPLRRPPGGIAPSRFPRPDARRSAVYAKIAEAWRARRRPRHHGRQGSTHRARQAARDGEARRGAGHQVTYMPFIMRRPRSRVTPSSTDASEGPELVHFAYVNLGIATDTANGLIVPVIREVQAKGILQLAAELQDLAERTRAGKVRPDELQGGTFTITNAGNIGGIHATPIINFPEIAILGVHRIMKKPGVVETPQGDRIEVRQYMNLSASVDHRLADGANAARFLVTMKRLLENPGLLAL